MRVDVSRQWPLALFAAALIVRVVWVLLYTNRGLTFSDDAKAYHDLAVNLVERHRFVTAIDPPHRLDNPYATRPPLTPFALAAVYAIVGPHLLAGQLLLAAIGALVPVAVYWLGRDLFWSDVGILAGVLATVYPFFVFLAAVPLTENLAIPLYCFLALALVRGATAGDWRYAVASGCLLGLATLNRPQILGFLPLLVPLVAVAWGSALREKLRNLALMVGCAAVIVAPWSVRNYVVFHRSIPVSLQAGSALYQGNNPYTQTALTHLEHGARGWYNDERWGGDLTAASPVEVDGQAFRLAAAFMRAYPGQALDFAMQKIGIFFSAYDDPISRASWYPVLALSLLGLWWTAHDWRRLLPIFLLVAQTIVTAAIFTSLPRFRAPVEPFFVLLAAVALLRIRDWWASRSRVRPA